MLKKINPLILIMFALVSFLIFPQTARADSSKTVSGTNLSGDVVSATSDDGTDAGQTGGGDDTGTTNDSIKDHDVGYQTLCWTITRCQPGLKSSYPDGVESNYLYVPYTKETFQDITNGDGTSHSLFVIDHDKFLAFIQANYPDWYAELNSGKLNYVRMDAVMITIDTGLKTKAQKSGIVSGVKSDGSLPSEVKLIPNKNNPKPNVYTKYTQNDLLDVYNWEWPEGITTHFNIFIPFGEEDKKVVTPPEDAENDWYIGADGKDTPEYYAWNTSNEFDVGTAIPSGEDITSGVGQDTWYGKYKVRGHSEEKNYDLAYKFEFEWSKKVRDEGYYDDDGDGQTEYHEALYKSGVETTKLDYTVSRKAQYTYLSEINFYEIANTLVTNGVYPGGLLNYTFSGAKIPMDAILDGILNPETVDDWATDVDKHILWPKAYTSTIVVSDSGYESAEEALAAAEKKKAEYEEALAAEKTTNVKADVDPIDLVTSWNDYLNIDGHLLMDNTKERAVDTGFEEDTSLGWIPQLTNGDDPALYKFTESEKTVPIPAETANDKYPTSMQVTYIKRLLATSTVKNFVAAPIEPGHVKPGYENNEPVYVHTPVISPVEIINGETKTQLVKENITSDEKITDNVGSTGRTSDGKAVAELILDNTYTFKFDAAMHREIKGYGWSGDPSKYDEYVKAKWVRFPFFVAIDGYYYSPLKDADHYNKENGMYYTDWIKCNDTTTAFYIPPFAEENTYWEIEYMVWASNVMDQYGNGHFDAKEAYANVTTGDDNIGDNYIATYIIPTELSGIIYDFTILGTNNYADYSDEVTSKGSAVNGDIAFAVSKTEKKNPLNRFGNSWVRYTLDGFITNDWQYENTLPMGLGKSDVWSNEGYLKAGESFAFSVKTIANLWDEDGDYLNIKPSFRYYSLNGTPHNDIQAYYPNPDGNGYIRMGSEEDTNSVKYADLTGGLSESTDYRTFTFWNSQLGGSLWDEEFSLNNHNLLLSSALSSYDGKFHDEDLIYTIKKHKEADGDDSAVTDDDVCKFFATKTASECMSYITLTSDMRTLTGDYNEIRVNEKDNPDSLSTSDFGSNITDNDISMMDYCMQTWYGTYYIPYGLLICDADTFEKLGVKDADKDGVIDYNDYIETFNHGKDNDGNKVEGIDTTCDFWLNNEFPDGYLVLNFDITSTNHKDGQVVNQLTYGGGTNDMWKTQGCPDEDEEVPIGDDEVGKTDIHLDPGDVAIVKLGENVTNYELQEITP